MSDCPCSPEETYRARRERFTRERDDLTRQWNRLANQRLLVFLACVGFLVGSLVTRLLLPLLAAAVLFAWFLLLVGRHGLVGRARRRAQEMLAINVEAGQRLGRAWESLPLRHRARAAPGHPYAADLDIFGRASLAHLLDTDKTAVGDATLSRWLADLSPGDAARERRAAAAELARMLDLRQEMELAARRAGEFKPDPEPFLAWADGEPWLVHLRGIVWAARLSTSLLVAFAIGQVAGWVDAPLWLPFLVSNITLYRRVGSRAYAQVNRVWEQQRTFAEYADLFELLSEASFDAPELKWLQSRLKAGGLKAYEQMRRLSRISAFSIPRSAQLYWPIQIVTLWDIHVLAALERWQGSVGSRARGWLAALGDGEALAALACLAHDNPEWTFPEIDDRAASLEARDLAHPLLPDGVRVANDVTVGPPGSFLLVTGSNMSGKSTLLRAIGVNIVLAGAGGPVCASAYHAPPLTLWTSMRVSDSLEQGVSYFMAELQRLKQVVDAAGSARVQDIRLLYLLDEILQGTNTAERQIAARRIVAHLAAQGTVGAVSTHDLSLAEAPRIAAIARPIHFTETVTYGADGPAMSFDYKLRPGIATSTNALALMQIVGLDLGDGGSNG